MSSFTIDLARHGTDIDRNITIATFAEFGLYKKEAYETNLWAGKILAEHGVPLAYKSVSGFHPIPYTVCSIPLART